MFAENLMKKIDAIQCVKSVQRGTCTLGTNGSDITVSINKINIDKAMVLLQGSGFQSDKISTSYIYCSTGIYISSVTETSFVISQQLSSDSSKGISWQVIEFY